MNAGVKGRRIGSSQEANVRLREIMTSNVVTLPAEASEDEALALMRRAGIHHVVIVRRDKVVGVVSDRDLDASAGLFRIKRTVGDLMVPSVSADVDTTLGEAARLMRGRSIGCLPVVEHARLAGIVTLSDALALLARRAERRVARSRDWDIKTRLPRRKAAEHVH